MSQSNPICIAIDTPDTSRAMALAGALRGHVGFLKVGLEFFYAHGAAGYDAVARCGIPIFLDLKLHDIPNTVAQALRSLAQLERPPAIVNVHAQGGLAMMKEARAALPPHIKLIAVTVLTSLSDEDCYATGHDLAASPLALRLAQLTHQAGLDGIVCSPHELRAVRQSLPRSFLTVVPGIRPAEVAAHDQKRVATPRTALDHGADILVIGRAITGAADPVAACNAILESLDR
jgi:orotidine-5'-phosphate decarboxylase